MASEFGPDVVDLIPASLPLKEQRDLAEKLAAKLGAQVAPPQTESETPAAPEEPTEAEKRLAAVTSGAGQSGAPAVTITSAEEAVNLYLISPDTYAKMRAAGLINLPKLPGSDKE